MPTANCFSQNAWTQKATMPGLARHRIFAFSIGSRGYIGCGWNGTDMYHDVFEYDPGNNSWTQKADYPGGDRLCPFSFAIGNKGYVGAGLDNTLTSTGDFYEFDPVVNLWTQKNNFGGSPRFGCATAVYNNKAYVAMGDEWAPNYIRQDDLWIYDPTLDTWNYLFTWPADGRRDPIGFTLGNKLYFGTGADNSGWGNNDFWSYDPSNGVWTQKAFCGSARAQGTGFAVNGKGYVGLGQDNLGIDRNDFLEYDPVLNTWRGITPFSGASRENSYAFVIGNLAYVTCGTNGINYNDIWEFNSVWATGINVSASPQLSVSVFPDPVVSSCTIAVKGSKMIGTFDLYDVTGNRVRHFSFNKENFTLEREDLTSGIYFYHVVTSDHLSTSGKLLVQ